ncbi:HDOD domain-containing protein, partial [archaeon]|nr:HDOD domain-containing protein [archaeon]
MVMDREAGNACLERHIESIPTLEASRMRLLDVLQDEDVDFERLEGVISADPAMAAKVIKLANSPFYRHANEALGIHKALMTIGMDMVKCLTLSMAVINSLKIESGHARALWSHSYATALIALSLSRDRHEKEHLFTGALLHDLGRMVFMFREPESYVPLIEFDGSWPDIHLENDVFSIDHTVLGEAVAKKWHFPEEVTMIIKNHHAPVNRTSALVCLINNVICRKDQDDKTAEMPCSRLMEKYLGDAHKELVNTILQRYK